MYSQCHLSTSLIHPLPSVFALQRLSPEFGRPSVGVGRPSVGVGRPSAGVGRPSAGVGRLLPESGHS